MVDQPPLTKKSGEIKQEAKAEAPAAAAPPPEVAKEETKEEKAPQTMEIASLHNGIQITIEGDFATLKLSQYLAEHIGQNRRCDHILIRFKHGAAPDITAINTQE